MAAFELVQVVNQRGWLRQMGPSTRIGSSELLTQLSNQFEEKHALMQPSAELMSSSMNLTAVGLASRLMPQSACAVLLSSFAPGEARSNRIGDLVGEATGSGVFKRLSPRL